ncbi:MAG: EAL domain-containing protein, partial [Candidatus Dadabacteria bacterium]
AVRMQPATILVVDDDERVTRALVRLLRRDGHEVRTATSARAAEEALREGEVAVLLSDYRMPGEDGVTLLRRARQLRPDTVRIMLTGSADLKAAVAAVNEGAVFKFVLKPWDDDWLRATVAEAVQQYRAVRERARLVAEIEEANARLQELNAELEQALRRRARDLEFARRHDPLTRLPNREQFGLQLADALRAARLAEKPVALLVLDLDRFKAVNEALSHAAGDAVLRSTAARITACLRRSDLVGRVGSDEFAVALVGYADPDLPARVARRILNALSEPLQVEGRDVFLTASLGVGVFPEDASSAEDLLKRADLAMHHAKEAGGNRFEYYSEEMNARAFERMMLETALRGALDRGEYRLFFQPQVDLRTGRFVAAEALLRWEHPELGLVSPARFVPLLEETGLIVPVGEWVIAEACRWARAWEAELPQGFRIAVNLSPRQLLRDDLPDRAGEILAAAGFSAEHNPLELEITESGVMGHPERAARLLGRLRDLGFRLAVDDFGTGYSSLAYLRRFRLNALKIDRSFVHDLPGQAEDAAIVRAILALGHELGLEVVAEGIETGEQAEFLGALGCDKAQGYWFARPLPPDQALPTLRTPARPTGTG